MGSPLQLHPAMSLLKDIQKEPGAVVYRMEGKSIKHPKMPERQWRIKCPGCGIRSGGITKTQKIFRCPIRGCGFSSPIEDEKA